MEFMAEFPECYSEQDPPVPSRIDPALQIVTNNANGARGPHRSCSPGKRQRISVKAEPSEPCEQSQPRGSTADWLLGKIFSESLPQDVMRRVMPPYTREMRGLPTSEQSDARERSIKLEHANQDEGEHSSQREHAHDASTDNREPLSGNLAHLKARMLH